jgi:hypothetical protein
LRENDFDLSVYEQEIANARNRLQGKRKFQRRRVSYAQTALDRLHESVLTVRHGDVVVLFRDLKPMVLDQTRGGQQLIKILTRPKGVREGDSGIPDSLESDLDPEAWSRLVSEFRPAVDFTTRAETHIAEIESVQQSNATIVIRSLWAARIEYPLLVYSMVVVAIAFGHLMSTKPYIATQDADSDSPQPAVFRSLLLVGLLSISDLIWTLVASQSASMRELNPLARQLIENPAFLVAFKASVTAIAIGLLYWLCESPIAQAASWWCCLVVTLLTARWLMFHSLFL